MTAPSIKEAFDEWFASNYGWLGVGDQLLKSDMKQAWDAALATFQPDGERREAIARKIDDLLQADIDFENADRKDVLTMHDRLKSARYALDTAIDNALASGLVQNEAGETYLVWSNEHSAWWGPKQCGYNTHISHAGRYSRKEAIAICVGARGGRAFNANPSEVPVLLKDAESFWTEAGLDERYRRECQEREEEERREEEEPAIRSARNRGAET